MDWGNWRGISRQYLPSQAFLSNVIYNELTIVKDILGEKVLRSFESFEEFVCTEKEQEDAVASFSSSNILQGTALKLAQREEAAEGKGILSHLYEIIFGVSGSNVHADKRVRA